VLYDNPSSLKPGFSFLDEPRNNLTDAYDWLISQVLKDIELRKKFIKLEDAACMQSFTAACNGYLAIQREFLSVILILVYFTAGLPPRREELIGVT